MAGPTTITGRCYCGAIQVKTNTPPQIVTYCHCEDCRRVTGAPVAAFAAFDEAAVTISGDAPQTARINPGVARSFCGECGTPIAGRYDYLPGQVFLSLGILDQADDLPPTMHAHHDKRLCWFDLQDELERVSASSRLQLQGAADKPRL